MRFQFTLRTLLIFVTVFGLATGAVIGVYRFVDATIMRIERDAPRELVLKTDVASPYDRSLLGSDESGAKYDPQTFRAEIARFINSRQFHKATALVRAADVERQVKFDGAGFVAVGEDTIVLPGVDPNVMYGRQRDWYMPGTSDVIQDRTWQAAATKFAKQYNLRRAGKGR